MQAVVFYYLSWVDTRFKDEVLTATNANGCDFPCQSSSKVASGGCCDSVFLPHIENTNIYALSQARSSRKLTLHIHEACCGSGICMPPASSCGDTA